MHRAAGGAVRPSLDIWKTVERLFVRLNSGRDLLPGTRAHNHHHAHDLDPRDSQLWQGKTPRRSLSRVIEYHQRVSVELTCSFGHRGQEALRACIDRTAYARAA